MSTSDSTASEIARLRDASEWVQRLNESREDAHALTHEWMQWCDADALNLPAFEQMQRLWDAFGVVEDTNNATPRSARRRIRHIGLGALAASIITAVGAAAWFISQYSEAREIATPIGRQLNTILADGTRLDLAPDSLVSTRFTPTGRDVHLWRGQAFFAVTHSPVRPFTVHVRTLTVTATGTAFDVRIGPSSTTVTVSAGEVRVSSRWDGPDGAYISRMTPVLAGAGQRVTLAKATQRLSVETVDPAVAESWRAGTLEFVGESLEEVVGAVNRYSAARIVVAPELQQARFTGTVSPSNIREWLKALEQIYAVKVVDQGFSGVLIRSRVHRDVHD